MENGVVMPTEEGSPQGGNLSTGSHEAVEEVQDEAERPFFPEVCSEHQIGT